MTRRPRVLVFHKESESQRVESREPADPLILRMREARGDHRQAMERLQDILFRMPVSVRYVPLSEPVEAEGYDLVIALGGDGTVLHASHQIGSTPVLAINSAPRHSVGFLTATTIDGAEDLVAGALEGRLPVTELQRMAVDVDGARTNGRVLNDVLFTHECPASTARYVIRHGEVEELQTSSGIWVGPAAGSTAAQRSAGGRVLPPRSKKIQFVVREPYRGGGCTYELIRGVVSPGERLELRSLMHSARLYVDGPHVVIPLRLGVTIRLGLSDEPLKLLAFKRPEEP